MEYPDQTYATEELIKIITPSIGEHEVQLYFVVGKWLGVITNTESGNRVTLHLNFFNHEFVYMIGPSCIRHNNFIEKQIWELVAEFLIKPKLIKTVTSQ